MCRRPNGTFTNDFWRETFATHLWERNGGEGKEKGGRGLGSKGDREQGEGVVKVSKKWQMSDQWARSRKHGVMC